MRAFDDPLDLAQPRGKQDWLLEPHAIWYPRTTGIWQTAWPERVPSASVATLTWTSSIERWEIRLRASIAGAQRDDRRLRVRLSVGDTQLADDTYTVPEHGELERGLGLFVPGIDDQRRKLLWSSSTPRLIQAEVTLLDARGEVVDGVHSYTALRSVPHGGRASSAQRAAHHAQICAGSGLLADQWSNRAG